MGHVFRRSSGRGWRLRRRSMELWPQWIEALQAHQPELRLHCGLLQIAEDEQAAERMASLAAQRADLGLQMVANSDLATVWPIARHGGLHSLQDGRVDPLLLQRALRLALAEQSVELNPTAVVQLERNNHHWRVHRADGDCSVHDVVLLCTPPGFRPEHLRYAVEAGRHIFTEKPMATDAPGLRSVLESVAISKNKPFSMLAGFCWRYDYQKKALFERCLGGEIGDIRTLCGSETSPEIYNTLPSLSNEGIGVIFSPSSRFSGCLNHIVPIPNFLEKASASCI